MEWLSDPGIWVALLTLTALELVLGIDNLIFISVLASRLPVEQQDKARRLGLGVALLSRIVLLFSLTWVIGLTQPLFTLFGHAVSGRDLLLIVGGIFLVGKATVELHHKVEGEADRKAGKAVQTATFGAVLLQIALIDVVFSLDSVITAVGMVDQIAIMIAANVIAMAVMVIAVNPLSSFVDRHPTVTVLALSFLVMIGGNLIAEGFGYHIPKGYTYFAMGFAVLVEFVNMRIRTQAVEAAAPGAPDHG